MIAGVGRAGLISMVADGRDIDINLHVVLRQASGRLLHFGLPAAVQWLSNTASAPAGRLLLQRQAGQTELMQYGGHLQALRLRTPGLPERAAMGRGSGGS